MSSFHLLYKNIAIERSNITRWTVQDSVVPGNVNITIVSNNGKEITPLCVEAYEGARFIGWIVNEPDDDLIVDAIFDERLAF